MIETASADFRIATVAISEPPVNESNTHTLDAAPRQLQGGKGVERVLQGWLCYTAPGSQKALSLKHFVPADQNTTAARASSSALAARSPWTIGTYGGKG